VGQPGIRERARVMVILRGIVRDGEGSTETADFPITSAAIIQGSRVTYTSSNGTFFTSADTTFSYAICQATGHKDASYSVPIFSTRYDPLGVLSGSITSINTTSIPGSTVITDYNKIFLSGILVNRVLEMRNGIDDGKFATIDANTNNQITLGLGTVWVWVF
jgi:hypothetical protein